MTKNENAYIVGIIAEYNPLHKGHAWHIQKAKELAGAKYCVAVMSGDFVQRGAAPIWYWRCRPSSPPAVRKISRPAGSRSWTAWALSVPSVLEANAAIWKKFPVLLLF